MQIMVSLPIISLHLLKNINMVKQDDLAIIDEISSGIVQI